MKDALVLIQENCWKRIGVWGRRTPRCPELERVIHCRNCEVFTQAGRNLLERPLPDDYRDQWTQVLAEKKEEEPLGVLSVVIFRLRNEWLALPTGILAEIIEAQPIHRVPHREEGILVGVINLHGEIQLCISLKRLLGLEDETKGPEEVSLQKTFARMMVVNRGGERWVFPVDEICGIHHIPPSLLQNVPVTVAKAKMTFTKGILRWDDRDVAFLDEELMLYTLRRSTQ